MRLFTKDLLRIQPRPLHARQMLYHLRKDPSPHLHSFVLFSPTPGPKSHVQPVRRALTGCQPGWNFTLGIPVNYPICGILSWQLRLANNNKTSLLVGGIWVDDKKGTREEWTSSSWDTVFCFLSEPLHKPFLVLGVFEIGSVCPGWLQTAILLISASWVASIIQLWAPGTQRDT
jgi:hypothetical protein